MAKVKFYLEKRKNEKTKAPILLYYSFNGERFQYYTGEIINIKNYNADYWKKGGKPVNSQEKRAAAINYRLDLMEQKVYSIRTMHEAQGQSLSKKHLSEELDKVFKGKGLDKSTISVKDAYAEYLDFLLTNRSQWTYKKQRSTQKHLETFLGKDFQCLKYEDIDNKMIARFKAYFVNGGFRLKKEEGIVPFQHNTVAKYMNSFRDFLNWSKSDKQGYFKGSVDINEKEEDIEVVFLTKEELKKIETTEMPNIALEKVRDIFLFTCHTGMRYSDVFNLTKTDYKNDYLKFYIQKSGSVVSHTVPLIELPKRIINKYKDVEGDKLLPVFSNQCTNRYIKLVMKIAGITEDVVVAKKLANGQIIKEKKEKWQIISFHNARKTLTTQLVIENTSESIIKSITGHSKNSRSFAKYYKIKDEIKQHELERVFENK